MLALETAIDGMGIPGYHELQLTKHDATLLLLERDANAPEWNVGRDTLEYTAVRLSPPEQYAPNYTHMSTEKFLERS